jgi:hypothetical protein
MASRHHHVSTRQGWFKQPPALCNGGWNRTRVLCGWFLPPWNRRRLCHQWLEETKDATERVWCFPATGSSNYWLCQYLQFRNIILNSCKTVVSQVTSFSLLFWTWKGCLGHRSGSGVLEGVLIGSFCVGSQFIPLCAVLLEAIQELDSSRPNSA